MVHLILPLTKVFHNNNATAAAIKTTRKSLNPTHKKRRHQNVLDLTHEQLFMSRRCGHDGGMDKSLKGLVL